ncbi:MAG TPA: hypothetical protein VFM82_02775 [Flavobacteriaceae bacterium]|nr:hypothetical protein [Flavobacteriaceae bacterium]
MKTANIFRELVKNAEVDFSIKIEERHEINGIELELFSVEQIGLFAEDERYLIDECYKNDTDEKPTAYIWDKEMDESILFTDKEMEEVDAYLENLIEEKNKELRVDFETEKEEVLDYEAPELHAYNQGE